MEIKSIAQGVGDPILEHSPEKVKEYYEKLWGLKVSSVVLSSLLSFEDFDNWTDNCKVYCLVTEKDPRDEDFKTNTKKISDKLYKTYISKKEVEDALDTIRELPDNAD